VVQAAENPTSYGTVAKIDTPILRIPLTKTPPTIDGVMDEGEWEDSAALSGFWYDFAAAHFVFMAPIETQLQVYAAYDKENLYIAYSSPVYPENSWLRSRGRFPDVTHHPQYGLIWDDHVELELRPYENNAEAFRLGLFKWFINPFDTTADLYWSINHGEKREWQSKAAVRNGVTGERWTLEIAIPLESMVYANYEGNGGDGQPLVKLPPADGTAYRCWFTRGIGGNAAFFNVFDKHVWNTTKTKLIFDSASPVIQINEMGPIMEDIINLQITVKNHNTRSETVQLGFFVESQEGLIYSSYDAPELNEGLVELRPGEVKQLRLRKPFPGISVDGNTLWFDVRSAGRPAKTLFLTRLIDFHSMDGGVTYKGHTPVTFKKRRLDVIDMMRPPRRDFEFRYAFSSYTKKLEGIVDIGIHGASEEAQRAAEAKCTVMKNDPGGTVVATKTVPLHGSFATVIMDVPFEDQQQYRVSLLLFDKNKRIVGERNPEPFTYEQWYWQDNDKGLDDIVWEPFTPIEVKEGEFGTLKHRFSVADTGLPAQIYIKPDPRELPLEKRPRSRSRETSGEESGDAETLKSHDFSYGLSDKELLQIGRGPQLRAPIRLEAEVGGKRYQAQVVKAAQPVREWESEIEYASQLKVGPIDVDLRTQYDCDGAMHCTLTYGSRASAKVDAFEMRMDVAGPVGLKATAVRGGGMSGVDVRECTLPSRPGVVWDSADMEYPDLFYTHFMPWLWFGSADRAFTYFCDTDKGWLIDRTGSTMHLERGRRGELSWVTKFVNHNSDVKGSRTIKFTLLTHPCKPKPENHRERAWMYRGAAWADEYFGGDFLKADEDLIAKARRMASVCDQLDGKNMTEEEIRKWSPKGPIYWRYYQNRSIGNVPGGRFDTEGLSKEEVKRLKFDELSGRGASLERYFPNKIAYFFDRHVGIGRRHGWWWDETWPVYRSARLAEGTAYLRDPADVREDELPYQEGFVSGHMRDAMKRLARIMKKHNIPNRNFYWANNEATCYEPLGYDAMLVEDCGGTNATFELDMLQVYPNSLFQYQAHNWTGLVTRIASENSAGFRSGDDERLNRQVLGIALLHDIGVTMEGPHGVFLQKEEAVPLLRKLYQFGFFEPGDIEKIPFWRNDRIIRFENNRPSADRGVLSKLEGDVEITVYRRPLDDGRKGYKALIVILNETDSPVEGPLTIQDFKRILGGPNTLTARDVRGQVEVPEQLESWWNQLAQRNADATVLMDLETGDVIAKSGTSGETYGPLYVPYHDYRLLYAEHAE
jgi:hypothetical protein